MRDIDKIRNDVNANVFIHIFYINDGSNDDSSSGGGGDGGGCGNNNRSNSHTYYIYL